MSLSILDSSHFRTASRNYLARCECDLVEVYSVTLEKIPSPHHVDSLVAHRKLPWLPTMFPLPYEVHCPHSSMQSVIQRYKVPRFGLGGPQQELDPVVSKGGHYACLVYILEMQGNSSKLELAANRAPGVVGLCDPAEVPDSSVP